MTLRNLPTTLGVATLSAALSIQEAAAQQPELLVSPAAARVLTQQNINWSLLGAPGSLYALFADSQPGPTTILGARVNLGLSTDLITLQVGFLSTVGDASGSILFTPPAGMAGLPFYFQHVEGNLARPGTVQASTPDAVGFHSGRFAIVENFRSSTWTGSFDRGVLYRLQGAPVRTRTHRTIDPQGVPFALGVRNPLNSFGARTQMVFRAVDVGATGEPETLTAVRWRPAGTVTPEVIGRIELSAGHTRVVPDYTIDPWSALPAAPNSGLDPLFANNLLPGRQVLFQGSYQVRPQDRTASGYMPYPTPGTFDYDGRSSLLLEIQVSPPMLPRPAVNGQFGRLMSVSSPDPAARVVAEGSAAAPLQPASATVGRGDNLLYDYELDFVRFVSEATSPWYSGGPNPDYMPPVVGHQVPRGTSYALEFRGADDAQGSNPTAWGRSQDIADGRGFLQIRVRLVGDPTTGEVPFLDTLVVPIR